MKAVCAWVTANLRPRALDDEDLVLLVVSQDS